jgi:hypothetical protein
LEFIVSFDITKIQTETLPNPWERGRVDHAFDLAGAPEVPYWAKRSKPTGGPPAMDMGKRCTDPQLELRIIKELAATAMQGKSVEISPESRSHLEECEKCKEFFPPWVEKGKAAYNDQQHDRVIEDAERGDSAILRKNVKQGLALFRPGTDGKPGVLVIVDPDHRAAMRVIDNTVTMEEFQAL